MWNRLDIFFKLNLEKCPKWSFVIAWLNFNSKSSLRISERGACLVQSRTWKSLLDAVSRLLLGQHLLFGNYLIIGFLTKQWRCRGVLVIFLWMWTCRSSWILFLASRQDFFKAGHQDRAWCLYLFDFRLQSDVWVDLQWVLTQLSKDKNLWWSRFSARPKFKPSEDFVQVVLCSLRLLGSVVGTRFAVCFDRGHAFSLDLCYGRVWT